MATVKADKVIENWATVVENGAGNGERLQRELESLLAEAKMPNVSWSMGEVTTGFLSGRREYLIIKHAGLREYMMYVFARDQGQHLACGWFLTVTPGMFKKRFSKYMTGNPIALSRDLDVFSQEDLGAWTHIVHRMFVKIATDLMREMQQDITGMSTTSKGFLSVW